MSVTKQDFSIDGRLIGFDEPTYMISELSGNHNGSLEKAFTMMEAAKAAGADAIKIQTYTADSLTIDSNAAPFQIQSGLWQGQNLYQLYQKAFTPWEWHEALFQKAKALEITLFSSPFDIAAVELLESLGCPAYKIASFEILDHELIAAAAATGKPLIMSTGMATLEEIEEAVTVARKAGAKELALLKCTSAYPADPKEMNLACIPHLASTFNLVSGLSDHTLGTSVPVAAVALGARIVEKHMTLLRADGGPDAAFSLEPQEFEEMVKAVRTIEQGLGQITYGPTAAEKKSLVFRRSLFVVKDIARGESLTKEHVRCIRPGHGMAPKHLNKVLGKRAEQDIPRGTPLTWDLVGG